MAFESMVYQVMIASPSDVAIERNIISKIIYEWNTIHAYKDKKVLLPVMWETHSSPEVGDSPQNILNNQILKMSDLLIGVFWTRLGTPTEKADSGTVEEIREHVKSGKPAMLYFSNQPVSPASVDHKQYEKLNKFKVECQGTTLYREYDSPKDFQEKLRRDLSLKIFNHEYFKNKNISDKRDEETTNKINLTKEAIKLLAEAVRTGSGEIRRISTDQGQMFLVDSIQFGTMGDPRSEATWNNAIKLLSNFNLVERDGPKGQVFKLTNDGYEYVDNLNS